MYASLCQMRPTPNVRPIFFAYFEGREGNRHNQEQLRLLVSDNGIDWHALNSNRRVISSDTISERWYSRPAYPAWCRRQNILYGCHRHEHCQQRLACKSGHRDAQVRRPYQLETLQGESERGLSQEFLGCLLGVGAADYLRPRSWQVHGILHPESRG